MHAWKIWVAILLLLDAGLGLWNAQRLAHVVPPRRLVWIASVEAVIAILLAIWHFSPSLGQQ
ncbi:MAG: hypothetical protein NZ740_08855 [Kiritimatiellae bacterium]|nr:hypothetical protein [Kiritimatiellia bacterium]MDW8459201.1 hypothetical protein [Verrucomicrobiota bacterium]